MLYDISLPFLPLFFSKHIHFYVNAVGGAGGEKDTLKRKLTAEAERTNPVDLKILKCPQYFVYVQAYLLFLSPQLKIGSHEILTTLICPVCYSSRNTCKKPSLLIFILFYFVTFQCSMPLNLFHFSWHM